MKLLLYISAILYLSTCWSQKIDPDYKKMIERKYSLPTISPDSLQRNLSNEDYIILDTRQNEEFNVSHIPGAIEFGYENPHYDKLKGTDTTKTIVLYCSIGVRSEKIAENLKQKGFSDVYNLYGGVFLWADQYRPLEDTRGQSTEKVHGYNKFWGRWVKNATVVYE